MDSAVTVFSRQGLFAQRIKARDIPSREHARKLWPFVIADDNRKPVTYVSPSFDSNGKLKQRSHFRTLNSTHTIDIKKIFCDEEQQRQKGVSESDEHKEAKKVLMAEMQNRLSNGKGLPWSFKDPAASDFHFEGNLLLGANKIVDEHSVQTPFGMGFRLDLAVLASPLRNDEIILGGIEIERTHAFEGRKALLGKSLGFPLISIDISEMSLDEITPTWAASVLSQTTATKEISHRQTYVYIHDLVYPLFVQIPNAILNEEKHQYLVFAVDQVLNDLVKWINKLAELLEYPKNTVTPSIVNATNDVTRKALNRAGEVVGSDWQRFNNQKCLRLTLPRSTGVTDLKAHKFHIVLAYLLLNKTDSLVGYKYCNGIDNNNINEDIWIMKTWKKDLPPTFSEHRILPKRLAEPINQMLSVINTIQSN